ncbi:hypothetical protein N7414_28205 [Pseudomonas sp. GD04087]|uniref:hypothetical protein n=1 Tax=unclassified Pseudomonas TaxID=196821 RepID=UPI002448FA3C|nr:MULTISPECIES: hypothetical protein [unclassified Pseudomonas]MDH0293022.1 hypothetical protein [Pseudomonas sp. GD04087]MDH1053105.1 hypothetical protein [Pseudomonas sp. GD03903]MDH2003096.1 hypothetical protein [Pseudomonas sp. GD03691]
MSYGLQVFDGGGGLSFDSNSLTCRMVYRIAIPNSGNAQDFVIPGFDSARGAVWIDTAWAGSGSTYAPRYTVSGSTVTVLSNTPSSGTNYLNAVMFS